MTRKKLLLRPDLTEKWRIVTHTNLGELYDRQDRCDDAFEHFRQANDLKPGRFDSVRHQRAVDEIIAAYSRDLMARLPRSSMRSDLPVFILGMPRSGTSLVEQILASHAQVTGAGELTDIGWLPERVQNSLGSDLPYPRCLDALTQQRLDEYAAQYLDRLRTFSTTAARVTDKMPYNFLLVGLIRLLFPHAPIIHCVRHPRDTCLSCYTRNFLATSTHTNDLRMLGEYYVQYERLMRHWKETLAIEMLDVSYEQLVQDPVSMSRKIVEHVGLPWDDDCLRFHESKRFMNTASYQQVRQPIYTRSAGRWAKYKQHLGPLIQALRQGSADQ